MERIALVKVTDRRKGSMARICPGGDCHLCLNQRASAINVYDYFTHVLHFAYDTSYCKRWKLEWRKYVKGYMYINRKTIYCT